MISLRELQEKDAKLMLEWMHDVDIQKGFKKNMLDATLEDAKAFCKRSEIPDELSDGDNLHFAIVNEEDEYLGTISLKSISLENRSAEYAITTRKTVQGQGIAKEATGILLEKAFHEYGLHRVYLSVFADNLAAIHLYEQCGFVYEGVFRKHLKRDNQYVDWRWYGMLEAEYNKQLFERDLSYCYDKKGIRDE